MSTTSATTAPGACIGEPISWLRLERYALDHGDAHVRDHLQACPACRACLETIERDFVALPVLAVPPPRRRWWHFALPVFAAAAAAAIALVVIRPREDNAVKGDELVIELQRERSGVVREDVRTFAAGDRWKVVVTCPPQTVAVDVTVLEAGAAQPDRPLPSTQITCGNRIVLPGAFTLTGDKPHEVCATVGARTACVTIEPEPARP